MAATEDAVAAPPASYEPAPVADPEPVPVAEDPAPAEEYAADPAPAEEYAADPDPAPDAPAGDGKRYRCEYDYTAADTDEVSFAENDVIIDAEVIDEGWMRVCVLV